MFWRWALQSITLSSQAQRYSVHHASYIVLVVLLIEPTKSHSHTTLPTTLDCEDGVVGRAVVVPDHLRLASMPPPTGADDWSGKTTIANDIVVVRESVSEWLTLRAHEYHDEGFGGLLSKV
jgi:hypothetical protein